MHFSSKIRANRPVKAVLFDLDKTLVTKEYDLFEQLYIDTHAYMHDKGIVNELVVFNQEEIYSMPISEYFQMHYGSQSDKALEYFYTLAAETERQPTPMSNADEVMAYLEASGIPYAIVSNASSNYVKHVISTLFPERTPHIVLGNAGKPDPDIIKDVIASMGLEASKNVLYVGDSRRYDIVAALDAGITPIFAPSKYQHELLNYDVNEKRTGLNPDQDYIENNSVINISDLYEIKGIIERYEQRSASLIH